MDAETRKGNLSPSSIMTSLLHGEAELSTCGQLEPSESVLRKRAAAEAEKYRDEQRNAPRKQAPQVVTEQPARRLTRAQREMLPRVKAKSQLN